MNNILCNKCSSNHEEKKDYLSYFKLTNNKKDSDAKDAKKEKNDIMIIDSQGNYLTRDELKERELKSFEMSLDCAPFAKYMG